MKKLTTIIICLTIPILLLSSNFYTNLYEEGKKLYLAGNYEEAVENFRIAEFGLMENKTVLKDMYLYYSLAHFKQSNGDEVIKFTSKLKELAGVSSFRELKLPEEIKGDLETMFSVIDKTYKKEVKKKIGKNKAGSKKIKEIKSEEYNEVYDSVRDSLKGNDLPAVKSGLKKLKNLGKTDLRTRHVAGIIYFRESNYKKSIYELLPVSRTDSEDLVNESSYYLALSNYFLKNYGQFLAFSQKVMDEDTNGKLSEISNKVKNIREAGIRNIKDKFFNKKNFKRFVSMFNGDIFLGSDILKEVNKMIPLRVMDIYYMADSALKYPGIYDSEFITGILNMLTEKDMEEYAEDIVLRSKFYKMDTIESLEVLYKLGVLYNNMGKIKKMKKIMLRVKKLSADYKKVDYYLTN